MKNQTEKDSNEKLGFGPSILVVPLALEGTARTANTREYTDGAFTPNPVQFMFGRDNERIIVSPLLQDSNDFYTFADPAKLPCIELGFLMGRQEPEIVLSDIPTADEMLTSDRIIYKVRHEYEAAITDFRGAGANLVV
jgi:hypothetical protein